MIAIVQLLVCLTLCWQIVHGNTKPKWNPVRPIINPSEEISSNVVNEIYRDLPLNAPFQKVSRNRNVRLNRPRRTNSGQGFYSQPPSPPSSYGNNCGDGMVEAADGSCVQPIINRNIFVFKAPPRNTKPQPPPPVPTPEVNYNIVFVKTPDPMPNQQPIVVPPPQEKTLVYVLSKESDAVGPQVIEMPEQPPMDPEVYYINYKEGENVQLPGGFDLETALASARAQDGESIDTSGGAGPNSQYGAPTDIEPQYQIP